MIQIEDVVGGPGAYLVALVAAQVALRRIPPQLLVLPLLLDSGGHRARAGRLADNVAVESRESPVAGDGQPIHDAIGELGVKPKVLAR